MIPAEARDILFYYGSTIVFFCLLLFWATGRKRKGMRLRLKGGTRGKLENASYDNVINLAGHASQSPEKFSHIEERGERPLNVVFNYNGHSWDAYEILGLPAGSSPDNVDHAYREALKTVDVGSRAFMEAAYRAIQAEWKVFKTGSR